jgi:aldehyde:ferredoxin oxidoreductase
MSATASQYLQVGASAGVCIMPMMFFGNYPLVAFFNAVTGWNLDVAEVLTTGARIQTLRQCFNLREGFSPAAVKLPDRIAGLPPHKDGPLAGITIDVDNLAREYRQAMGWDADSGKPHKSTLEKLNLTKLIEAYG